MGDIPSNELKKFELDQTQQLKNALISNLRDNKRNKQVIQLNGKSSLIFANLAALTLASCGGGGGGGSSAPTPVASAPSFSSQSFTFTEDTPGTFSISPPTDPNGDSLTITVDSIPSGITLTTEDGTVLTSGLTLTNAQLSNISFSADENLNTSTTSLSALVLTASDGSESNSANITFNITAVNDLPVASLDPVSFTEDVAATFNLTVTDVDGDILTITVEAVPAGGVITTASGATVAVGTVLAAEDLTGLTFTPNENANSDDVTIGDLVLSVEETTATDSVSISIVVTAVNDAPTLGTIAAVDVLETVAADATLLTLAGEDVDDTTLTYSLTGDDAALFDVDSSGNVSFKASPNFKAPGDADTDNTYSLNLVVTDAAGLTASSALSINVLDVKPSGQAIDGYLVGATVWVDLDGDGIKDENEPETTTDKTGAFEFEDDIPADTDIYVEGGYDLGTGKPNEQKFKLTTSITGDGSEALVISPVSTQISRAYAKTGVTLADAQEKVAKAYGLDEVFDNLTNFDPIALAYSATSNSEAQAALTAQARNIMVSSLGELSKKVSEYFSTEIAPTTRSQISDVFKFGTQTLRYSSWDSGVDLTEQPRIVIELEGFEDLLASTSDTFNDKIVEAILSSSDLTKLFEMKSDGTGQFDAVIGQATAAIILEIKNLILSEMGFDPATNFTTFKSLDNYTGETVTFLGSTKTMGEWAVIMVDILDSQQPDPYTGRVNFGPDGGVTDMAGKYFSEQLIKMVRLMETMTGLTFENLTDSQIDQLVDMGLEYTRGTTFSDSYTRWVPFDEYGQELWSQSVQFNYSGERYRYDSNGNRIEGNTGQWQLTGDQIKAWLKNPAIKLKDGNWGNEFDTYNWTTTSGDLGMYLALAEGRTPEEVKVLMDNLNATSDSISNFVDILSASFDQGTKVFTNLVTGALDFTLDKFTKFVEKTIDYDQDQVWLPKDAFGMAVSTIQTVAIPASDETISVTVVDGKFYFDGVLAANKTLKSGATYTFDQSDPSNANNLLSLSDTQDGVNGGGAEYLTGVTYTGTPGESGASTKISVTDSTSPLYFYSLAGLGRGNDTLLTTSAAVTMELETVSGMGWQVTGDGLSLRIQESGDFSYSITGGVDKDLFRISDSGKIAFKDSAPDPLNPNDSNGDGEYIIEITITDNTDGFTQAVEFTMSIPDWNETRSYATDTAPGLADESRVVTIDEHVIARAWSSWDEENQTNIELTEGIEIKLTGVEGLDPSTFNVWLRERDDNGNPIKDNANFWLFHDRDNGKFYLNLREGNALDFEAPRDANGDNVYELILGIEVYGGSGESVGTTEEFLLIVNDTQEDPQAFFPNWVTDPSQTTADGTTITWQWSANEAPVADLTEITVGGTPATSVFVTGRVLSLQHQDGGNPQTLEELMAIRFGGQPVSSITGGADADLFIVRDTEWDTQIFFRSRPDFDNPTDADGDNIYEFELTKTAPDGSSVSELIKIYINSATSSNEEGSTYSAPEKPSSPLILTVDEVAENIGNEQGSRNVVGTDGDDSFTRETQKGWAYIDGGQGNDNFGSNIDGHFTGGEGADIFQISLQNVADLNNFGIRDYSKAQSEDGKQGINGYDQNRDGTLDLSSEIDWSWVPLIADFTPGTDKLALTTYGWTGMNVPSIAKADVSIVQGTGELSPHALVLISGKAAQDRGYSDGGVLAVLLDTDASTVSMDNDVTEAGNQYETQLGNIKDALGATVTSTTATNGNEIPILQLPDGNFVWLEADWNDVDNSAFFQNFALGPDGTFYAPRPENLDFENPKDANKDNVYELLFVGRVFSTVELVQQEWGGYNVNWENSTDLGIIAFSVFIEVKDKISDNVGKLSIAEANFMNDDGTLNSSMVDLVLSQISAVQGSLMDIDMKAIAEEIQFDFSFFAMADAQTQAEDWFGNYQADSFRRFNEELESTFERNLLSKFSSYTNADSLTNLTGTAASETITGTDTKETIFGKKGDDIITGGGGDDVIFGDQGNDTLDGGSGADAVDGGSGDDKLIIGEGLDVLDGGSGDDTFDFSNITSLPEYIKGGSGTDTLILAGLSSVGLEVDDGTDADSLPDYTGIDLNKLVSVKETWTYTDESGNEQTEEGWRNRLESIEAIDLRDSQSVINKDYLDNQIDTVGFRLSSNKVTLTDSDGAVHSMYTTTAGSVLSANMVNASLNQANLAAIVSTDTSSGSSPVLSFKLDSIPAANTSGTSNVTLKLYDGTDNTQTGSERLLETTIQLNWSSDGSEVTVTLPPQTLTVNYLSADGNALTRTWTNAESDSLKVSYDSFGTPVLDIAIAKFFSGKGTAEGIDLTGYISSGSYFFDVSFSNIEFLDENDNTFTSVQGAFEVAANPGITAYIDNLATIESTETASVVVNLSKASASDVTIDYSTSDGTALAGSDYTATSGTLTIAAGQTSGTISIPVVKDDVAESPENLKVTLSNISGASLGRADATVTINNETVFSDILNITWDALQRMSWDNRTWTIRGDDTDTVRLLGHEYTYNEGSTLKTQFEPFRFKGTTQEDGVTYNVYELWDGRVKIEAGVTVVYGKRELGKSVAGENTRPDFWYQWKTVYENSVAVFGKVKDSWDRDGDTITYSLDPSYPDSALFNINSTTGEVTFKVAPNYEAPASISSGAAAIGNTEAAFSSQSAGNLRWLNQYRIKIIGDDGSGESNAQQTQELNVEVRNLPDYAGYDPTNKIPFFKDMWGSGAKFIDDAATQEIQIKGFDLDFDTLTWELVGMELWGDNFSWVRYGTMENGDTGNAIGDVPFTLNSTGVLKPNSVLSYETGPTTVKVYVSITDGKSTAVKKTFYFNVEDSIGDGSLTVNGTAMIGSYALAAATVWQDLDNDGVKDAGEPNTTTNEQGRFTLAVTKSDQDAPILATGGVDLGSGLANTGVLKINSNLKLATDRDWGEYSLSPTSGISLSMQGIDRSISDKQSLLDILTSFGMDPLWMEGDGNFYGDRWWDIKNRLDGNSSSGEWELFNLNVFTLNNLFNLVGNAASKAAIQIITDALADVNTKVSGTTNVSSYSAGALTSAQTTSIQQAAYQAAMDSIAEMVTGQTVFDGFRLSKSNPVTITDHEGSVDVKHTPSYSVSSNVLTLNSSEIQVNQSALQDALDLKAGAKGLKIEVEVGTLPTTAQTIDFTGKLIDGTDGTIDSGERSIEVRFQVLVDPTKEVGASDYVYVPASSDITVIYTGEDGTATSTTVTHSGNMVTVNVSDAGVPTFVVDFNEVFARGIPQTNLSTYFTTSTASDGNYYTELSFSGANLQTTAGESFNTVVAPFKVATTTTPVVYFEDVTVSEARGWDQITLTLSKPATETFTLEYNVSGGTATQNEDYWWWSDDTGYRSVTFVSGQSTAVINVDVRNDSESEGQETIIYGLRVASESAGKVILPKSSATVTISDDESSSTISFDTLTDKVLTAIQPILATELKTLTDANSADLSSSSTTFTNILLSNSDISDISTYLTSEVSEDITLYDPVVTAVMNLINTYTSAVRGPSGIRESVKIDGSTMATDFAALANGFDGLILSEFTSTATDGLNQALIDDIYSDSGFKYTGTTTISNTGDLTYVRTVDASSTAYDVLYPAGEGLRDASYNGPGSQYVTLGTSGDDTVTLTSNTNIIYSAGAGNDDITASGADAAIHIHGGSGNDIIKDTAGSDSRMLLDGGTGNDKLYSASFRNVKFKGGDGNDVFIIEYDTNWIWNSDNSFSGSDNNQDQTINWNEYSSMPAVIVDFQDGSDKIGLRGSDWSGKTIVVQQGTGSFSNHTFLLTGAIERGGDSDYRYWLILWDTDASTITADDFVLVDGSYGTSSLSGVTISTNLSDAGLETEDGVLNFDGKGSESIPQNSGLDLDMEDPTNILSSLIDENEGLNFNNLDINTNNLNSQVSNLHETLELEKFEAPIHESHESYSVFDELEEEELLFFTDSI